MASRMIKSKKNFYAKMQRNYDWGWQEWLHDCSSIGWGMQCDTTTESMSSDCINAVVDVKGICIFITGKCTKFLTSYS